MANAHVLRPGSIAPDFAITPGDGTVTHLNDRLGHVRAIDHAGAPAAFMMGAAFAIAAAAGLVVMMGTGNREPRS